MKEKNLKLWHAVSAWGILIVLLLFLIDSFTDFTSIDGLKNKMKEKKADKEAFIGKPEIKIKDGVFTPEAMLAMGRLSDPQVSPDGTKILYGVSYTVPPSRGSPQKGKVSQTHAGAPTGKASPSYRAGRYGQLS